MKKKLEEKFNPYQLNVIDESHLHEGNQKITDKLKYGQSITDACIGWHDTLAGLESLNEAVIKRRGK